MGINSEWIRRVGPSNDRVTNGKKYKVQGTRSIIDDNGAGMRPSMGMCRGTRYWIECRAIPTPVEPGDVVCVDVPGPPDFMCGNHNIKEEQQEMSEANIKTVVFIKGNKGSDLSDESIFKIIRSLEGQITGLEELKADSTKVKETINQLKQDIHDLVTYVDTRE